MQDSRLPAVYKLLLAANVTYYPTSSRDFFTCQSSSVTRGKANCASLFGQIALIGRPNQRGSPLGARYWRHVHPNVHWPDWARSNVISMLSGPIETFCAGIGRSLT